MSQFQVVPVIKDPTLGGMSLDIRNEQGKTVAILDISGVHQEIALKTPENEEVCVVSWSTDRFGKRFYQVEKDGKPITFSPED